MSSRIPPTSGVPATARATQLPSSSTREKSGGEVRTLVFSGPQPAPSLAPTPWGSTSGPELYKRVQTLPEGATTGSPETTPKDPEDARQQGIGRNVDRYA